MRQTGCPSLSHPGSGGAKLALSASGSPSHESESAAACKSMVHALAAPDIRTQMTRTTQIAQATATVFIFHSSRGARRPVAARPSGH